MRAAWLVTVALGCVYIDDATFEDMAAKLEEAPEEAPLPDDADTDDEAVWELLQISGDGQSAVVDAPLDAPLSVEVLEGDAPQEGVTVYWEASGDADIPATSTTDEQGVTQVHPTLGTVAGSYTFDAELPDAEVSLTFSATAEADASIEQLELEAYAGLDQTGLVSSPLEDPLVVVVRDRHDNPVPGIQISWIPPSQASVSNSLTTTNTDGLSQVTATLGEESGSYTFLALLTDDDGGEVSFEAWAEAYGG